MTSGGKDYLKRNEFRADLDEGTEIAAMLFSKLDKVTKKKLRDEIVGVTSDPVRWRVTKQEYAKGNKNIEMFLKITTYQPKESW